MEPTRPSTPLPPFDFLVGGSVPPARDLRISVIIPFHDRRGHPEHLAGWTREQTLPGEQFEVIAIVNSPDPELLRSIREYLRPQDIVLHAAVQDHFALYAIGGSVARARVLFFTEDHCQAEPGCLLGVAEYFSDPARTAATVRWSDINSTDVSLMEDLACQIGAREWFKPGHWNRLRIRGTALRGDVYRAAGGFEVDCYGFSEVLMSAKLHVAGVATGHIKESGIRHINTETLGHVRAGSKTYSQGECTYCDKHISEFSERYFSASSVLLKATHLPPAIAWWLAQAAGKVLSCMPPDAAAAPAWRAHLRGHILRLRASAILSPLRTMAARLSLAAAWLRYRFWRFNQQRRLRAFIDYWERIAQLVRVRYVAKHGAQFYRRHATGKLESRAGELHGAYGMYPLEFLEGTAFRWTSPASVIPFLLDAGDYEVTVSVAPFRGSPRHVPLGVFWNRHQVPAERLRVRSQSISFKVKRRHCDTGRLQQLTIIAAPLPPTPAERRLLGLPISAIRIEPRSQLANDATVARAEAKPK
jgi:hypothetical protein